MSDETSKRFFDELVEREIADIQKAIYKDSVQSVFGDASRKAAERQRVKIEMDTTKAPSWAMHFKHKGGTDDQVDALSHGAGWIDGGYAIEGPALEASSNASWEEDADLYGLDRETAKRIEGTINGAPRDRHTKMLVADVRAYFAEQCQRNYMQCVEFTFVPETNMLRAVVAKDRKGAHLFYDDALRTISWENGLKPRIDKDIAEAAVELNMAAARDSDFAVRYAADQKADAGRTLNIYVDDQY